MPVDQAGQTPSTDEDLHTAQHSLDAAEFL